MRPTGNALEFVKIRRGGERFWCIVRERRPDGSMRLQVDNSTIDPEAPRRGEMIDVPADEEILDRMMGQTKLRAIEGGAA